jgi:hypothetical protein
MERILTMDAEQAEKEKIELEKVVEEQNEKLAAADIEKQKLRKDLAEALQRCDSLQKSNLELEDKCVWGLELEQV